MSYYAERLTELAGDLHKVRFETIRALPRKFVNLGSEIQLLEEAGDWEHTGEKGLMEKLVQITDIARWLDEEVGTLEDMILTIAKLRERQQWEAERDHQRARSPVSILRVRVYSSSIMLDEIERRWLDPYGLGKYDVNKRVNIAKMEDHVLFFPRHPTTDILYDDAFTIAGGIRDIPGIRVVWEQLKYGELEPTFREIPFR